MGLVDAAKRLRRTATERLTPHPVVFHHVPKCGGTSVGRAIRKRYLLSQETILPEESFRALEAFSGRRDRDGMLVDVLDLREQMLLYLMFRDVRCIAAHVRFSEAAWRLFHDRYAFVTVLREPVERFVSHYHWSHGRPGAHAHIPEDFDSFLETGLARRLGATFVEYYCGLPKTVELASGKAVEAAKSNLERFDVVGFLDDLAGFADALATRLGARVRIGHDNRSRVASSSALDRLSARQRDRVEALCAPDIAVWTHARTSCRRPAGDGN